MNYIGIDISKISTAMTIETPSGEFYFSYNTNKHNYKWNTFASVFCNIKTYKYEKNDNYSISEINKLKIFSEISNDLLNDILNTIDKRYRALINIEGYSYGTKTSPGPIIDLAGIGGIIRNKILENILNLQLIHISAPKTLKIDTCKLVYGTKMVTIGVRKPKLVEKINPNTNGKSGGSFDKDDMFSAIIDYNQKSQLLSNIHLNLAHISNVKGIPKPYEDLIDSYFLKETIKNK